MFNNGDHVPEKSVVSVPMYAVHWDEKYYADPGGFDGFRFMKSCTLNLQGDAFPVWIWQTRMVTQKSDIVGQSLLKLRSEQFRTGIWSRDHEAVSCKLDTQL
jgi:hypothetical protein